MSKDFLIIGDSNVTRNYARLGLQVQNVAVVPARNILEVTQALRESVKSTYRIVVFACLTNLIIAAAEAGSNTQERLNAVSDMFNTLLPLFWFVLFFNFLPTLLVFRGGPETLCGLCQIRIFSGLCLFTVLFVLNF